MNHIIGVDDSEINKVWDSLDDRMVQAVKLIRDAPFNQYGIYVGHSGGKDSVLVRYITDRVHLGCPTIHTTKPAGVKNAVHEKTREFLYSMPRPVIYVPAHTFEGFVDSNGLRTQIDGTRIAEASRRDGRDVGVIIDGEERSRNDLKPYLTNGLFGLNFIYPIYDWSDAEVWGAIIKFQIPFSDEYLEQRE